MSAMRCFSRALRDCQATPPSRSSWRCLVARAVAAQHVDVLDRHEELVAALIGEAQAVVARVLDLQRDQALVAADAVLAMDDQVAVAERRGFGDEALRRAALLGGPRQAVA